MELFYKIIKYASLAAMILLAVISIVDSKSADIISVIPPTIACAAIYIGCVIRENKK